jgi:diphthamide synthase (EF-2-diphthine--ammonia ligase)
MAAACERAVAEGMYGVAFGDLFLEDIRAYRVAKLALTGLAPIFPCWLLPTDQLARDMITAGFVAHLTCVNPSCFAGPGISPSAARSFAGRTFDAALLADLPASVDPCGERGEFHTFVSAGPVFSRSIEVQRGEVVERDGFIYADFLPV